MAEVHELIPGTALPLGGVSQQPEGRGQIEHLAPGRQPVSMLERIGQRDDVSAAELAYLAAAIRAYDRRPRLLKTIYDAASGTCDPVTGNLVLPLFTAPMGTECHLTQILVDAVQSLTVVPSAPIINAGSFAILSVGPPTTSPSSSTVSQYRNGTACFWPNPSLATNPLLPVIQTFNDKNAPVITGGRAAVYCIKGASFASLQSLGIRVVYRVQVFGFEDGQL